MNAEILAVIAAALSPALMSEFVRILNCNYWLLTFLQYIH